MVCGLNKDERAVYFDGVYQINESLEVKYMRSENSVSLPEHTPFGEFAPLLAVLTVGTMKQNIVVAAETDPAKVEAEKQRRRTGRFQVFHEEKGRGKAQVRRSCGAEREHLRKGQAR